MKQHEYKRMNNIISTMLHGKIYHMNECWWWFV